MLSLVQPGLGQIYNGQIRKAVFIYALPLLLFPGIILYLNSAFIGAFLVAFATDTDVLPVGGDRCRKNLSKAIEGVFAEKGQ